MRQMIKKALISLKRSVIAARPRALALPQVVEIEPTNCCNLRCVMCHFPYLNDDRQFLDMALLSKLRCLENIWVVIGSSFEPMLHPKFIQLYEYLCSLGCKLDLTTNGTLFKPKLANQLITSALRSVNVSFDSVDPSVYERIRRNASFENTLEGILAFHRLLRPMGAFFSVNMTLMRHNMFGITDAVRFWEGKGFDLMRFPFMVVRNGTRELLEQSLFPVKDKAFSELDRAATEVLKNGLRITLSSPYFRRSSLLVQYPNNIRDGTVRSNNPYSREYFNPRHYFQNRPYRGMRGQCSSPYTFARILADGTVVLCNKFEVGNLHQADFDDIWFGDSAQSLRAEIKAQPSICGRCDYRRFCLESTKMDLDEKENYFADPLIPKIEDLERAYWSVENVAQVSQGSEQRNAGSTSD